MNAPAFFRARPLVAAALAYGAGVLCALPGAGQPPVLSLLGILLSLTALFLLLRRPALRVLCAALGFFFFGLLLGGFAAHPALPAQGKYRVEGRIAGDPVVRGANSHAQAELREVSLTDANGILIRVPGAYWTWYPGEGNILPGDGDLVSFTGNVYHPAPQMNPFGFDFRLYLLEQNVPIGISGSDDYRLQDVMESPAYRVRKAVGQRLALLFGEQAGLAKALLIGEKEGLSDQTKADFRDAGIAHVLAVSGLHVGFLVGALFLLLKPLRLSPWARFSVVSLLLFLYCALLGFQASVARACVLTAGMLMGAALRRRSDPLTSLSAAFLVILTLRPLDLLSVGFQLSFLAVLGIFTLGDALNRLIEKNRALSKWRQFPKAILKAYAVTLSASVLTAVPIVNTFHRFPMVSLLIGPLACLLVGWLMAGFFLALPVSLFSVPLAQALAWPVIRFAELYERFASFSASFSSLSPSFARIPWHAAALLLLLPLLLTRYTALRGRTRLAVAGSFLLAIITLFSIPRDTSVRYVQLSVGDADSAVMMDGKTTWAVDAGENGGELASFLQAEGRGIDLLFLTHLHADHAGGLRELLDKRIPVGQILIPKGAYVASAPEATVNLLQEAREAGISVREICAGDTFKANRAGLEVLWPGGNGIYPGSEANDASLVLLWDLADASLLTTGDVGARYAPYAYRPAQILKIPHHGSRVEADRGNLALVSSSLALVSASAARPDRYKASAELLSDMGIFTHFTGETGALTVRVLPGAIELTAHAGGAK